MNHRGWIALSGFLWFGAGFSLLYKGIHFIADGVRTAGTLTFHFREAFGSAESAGSVFIGIALIIGFLKGRFVLSKTVRRTSLRIQSLPLPISLFSVYPPAYWVLIASMIGLGLSLRFLPIPIDVRGLIDVAIGSALLNGAMLYFRAARSVARPQS